MRGFYHEISKSDLSQIIEVCDYILDTLLLQNYEEPDEGNQILKDLVEIEIIKIRDVVTSAYPTGGGKTELLPGFNNVA
ncbi:MAG: hypothetical protein NC489_43275 [Ruminococcus flavefaciens]|nr:hypothetical protein [Ruminococcus flavefaciens]